MGCDSSYMQPNGKEQAISQVACFLDELQGVRWSKSYFNGMHPRIYGRSFEADALVSELCAKLQKVDVTEYSLEMQMWWRDHKEADRLRVVRELQEMKEGADRRAAVEKLSDYELRLLGLKRVEK